MFLVTEWFGTFLLAADGSVKAERLFAKDAPKLALTLQKLQDGQILEEERELAVRADDEFHVREERQRRLVGAVLAESVPTLADRASEFGFTREMLHAATMELGKLGVRAASSRRDMHVLQAVDAIDELTEQANVAVERLREWYGLHFPEFTDAGGRNEEVAALISAHGTREGIIAAEPKFRVEDSMGGPLPELELAAVRAFARTASTLYSTKADLEKYLDEAVMEVAPNVATLLQPVLAARMLKQAGGLRRLATMPAGTIQTLGAEKALFRHIKEGKAPPKHGHLMQHPLVHRAPRYHRGALARSLAAKVALAARADAFTGNKELGAKLVIDFQIRADSLKEMQQRQRRSRAKQQQRAGTHTGKPFRGSGGPPRGGPSRGAPSRGPPRDGPRGGGGFGGGGGGSGPRRGFGPKGGDRQ